MNGKLDKFGSDFEISRRKFSGNYAMHKYHYHSGYEIYYLLGGGTEYFIENKIISVSPGDTVLIPPNVIHRTAAAEKGNERLLLSFHESFLNLPSSDPVYNCFGASIIRCDDICRVFLNMEEEYKRGIAASERYLRAALEYALFRLGSERSAEENSPHGGKNEEFLAVVDYINKNYGENLTLSSLAKTFAVSESHFSRTFKKSTGFGVCEYITTVRIRNAQKMLAETDFSVTEIANRCGFNDSSYFTSVFKRIRGISPLKYRKISAPHLDSGSSFVIK